MTKVISHQEENVDFYIQVMEDLEIIDTEEGGGEVAGITEDLHQLSNSFEDLSKAISITCNSFQNKIEKEMQQNKSKSKSKLSELTIEFGLSLEAKGGIIISSIGGKATLNITAKLKFD